MPKKCLTKEQILQAAVCVVQQGGPSALSVRHIASVLGCSTQPLYSVFGSFSQLQEELLTFIRRRYLTARCTSYRGFAQAFLRFASEEPELFPVFLSAPPAGQRRTAGRRERRAHCPAAIPKSVHAPRTGPPDAPAHAGALLRAGGDDCHRIRRHEPGGESTGS